MKFAALRRRSVRRGFTLIELLVVIAIIAILAAMLFPVMAVVRAKANQSSCQSQMGEIVRALKMYKDDWRVYPDALYGASYDGGPFETRLFPDYIKDRKTFNCPYSPAKLDDPANPRPPVTATNPMTGADATDLFNRTMGFADFSSYDFQYRPNVNTSGAREVHYRLRWTTTGSPSITDAPNQLIYKNPPDDTVVTWCLYHSEMQANGMPPQGRMAVVGFLSGRVQTIPAEKLASWPAECTSPGGNPPMNCPWQVQPKR